jgi:hypothetical protein
MRHQLYREIPRNYYKLHLQLKYSLSLAGLAQGAPLRFAECTDISFNVWNFYNDEKRRASLFELTEADVIARIYDKFGQIGMDQPGYTHIRAWEALGEIDERLIDRSLEQTIFLKTLPPQAQAFVKELLTGKRKPYREYLNPL